MYSEEPISNIVWIDVKELDKNNYNPNIVFTRELNLLKFSMLETWWIQPIIINKDKIIIDWYHRYMLSSTDKDIQARWGWKVPCVVIEKTRPKAMAMTVRINKAKGSHMAVAEQKIVKELYESWMTKGEMQEELWMTKQEVELLLTDTVFKKWNLKEYKFSQAWIPIK